MKKDFKPIIKSKKKVVSMFDFMKDTKQNELYDNVELQNNTNEEVKIINRQKFDAKIDDTDFEKEFEDEEIDISTPVNDNISNIENLKKDEVVILSRGRDNVIVNKTTLDENKQDAPQNSSNIVMVQSETYNGEKVVEKQKFSFKEWFKNLGVKTAQGWDNFIHKKGAVRFLAIASILVVLLIAVLIYTAVIKTNINNLFQSNVNAFVMGSNDESGDGKSVNVNLKDLSSDKISSKNTYGYQFIELNSKSIDEEIYINKFFFDIYTEYSDLTLDITLTIYDGEEIVWAMSEPKKLDIGQRIGRRVSFDYIGNITFKENVRFVIEFVGYKTSEKNNDDKSNYDVAFSITNMNYSE